MCCKLSTLHLSRDALRIISEKYRYITYHTLIGYFMYNRKKKFVTPSSDERFTFRSWRIRADAKPVSNASALTPATQGLEQAAVQAIPGCSRGRRARWRKKQTKRSASSREKGREARRALVFPFLQPYDKYIYVGGFHPIYYICHSFLNRPISRNAGSRSHGRLFSPLATAVPASHFNPENSSALLPSSTRVELRLLTLGAVGS